MEVDWVPEFHDPTYVRSKLEDGTCGVGSLTSYYEPSVDTQGSRKRGYLHNDFDGPASMFPALDVMPGNASAVNLGFAHHWGLTKPPKQDIDVGKLIYEESLGKMMGFRRNHDIEFKEEPLAKMLKHTVKDVYSITNENIDMHSGQGIHGMHTFSEAVTTEAKNISIQHNRGDTQMARWHGLERAKNPAIQGGPGEEVFHNTMDLPVNAPMATPMDLDVIEIDDTMVTVEDTMHILDGNV